ncbi:MAG: 3-oxoacyl-[acyl-carrier protein] reductase [Variovorax sp.]|jgi:NAD(P)-dependent dehydrogenase (short-subunit alcohol dehydrogenase family)|nr:3-oxoacyl-[acyl-carrier protein] reductase [Variovorax sp.]
MDFELAGRVIVVTGGASGIGLAVAQEAAAQGARIGIIDSSPAQADAALAAFRAAGVEALVEIVDVRDEAACEAATDRIERALGPIDGVAACAGISRPEPSESMLEETWDAVIGINLTGVFRSIRPAGRRMIQRRRGAIVTISSTDGLGGHAARAHYAASKHGVVGLTRSLAIEWGRYGVRVNAVAPGVVDTPLLRRNVPPEHVANAMIDRVPLGRFSTAREQANACLFLLSDASSYISGATLAVDGGLTAGYFTRWGGADYGSNALLERGLYGPPATPGA